MSADRDWASSAACREEDPELFFPAGTRGAYRSQIARAKLVCRLCPIRAACIDWALETGQEYGIWGGWDEAERGLLRQQRQHAEGAAA